MRRVLGFAMVAVGLGFPAVASGQTNNHSGGAAGGAVAGLVCGGATLTYSKLRGEGPLLWHSMNGPGWIAAFFVEHAAAGGMVGAFADGSRDGFVLGGAVTCGLDLVYIVASEILFAQEEPVMALAERDEHGEWRFGIPPIAVGKRSAWIPLLSVRF